MNETHRTICFVPALGMQSGNRHVILLPNASTKSGLNNIILTSTGAAKSLRLVLPEIERIGFIAQSVRVPIDTGSLIIMTVNIQDDSTNRKVINDIYRDDAHYPGDHPRMV